MYHEESDAFNLEGEPVRETLCPPAVIVVPPDDLEPAQRAQLIQDAVNAYIAGMQDIITALQSLDRVLAQPVMGIG